MSLTRSPNVSRRGPGRPSTRNMSTRQNPVSELSQQNSVAPTQNSEENSSMAPRLPPRSPSPRVRSRSVPIRSVTSPRNISFQIPTFTQTLSNPQQNMDTIPGPSTRPDTIIIPGTHIPPPPQCEQQAYNQNTAANVPLIDLRAMVRAIRSLDVPRPTFAGLDHEDPHAFLTQCETFLIDSAMDAAHWSRMVETYLTDEAAKWFTVYKNLSLPWTKFRSLLIQHFAGNSALNKLHVKLYAVKQGDRDPVGVFLQRKYLLALRLLPEATEEQHVSLLLESIKPSIKKILRAATLDSFETLFERAVQAEADEAEENLSKNRTTVPNQKTTAPAVQSSRAVPVSQGSSPAEQRPLPQCHYCPGLHFHRNCPVILAPPPRALLAHPNLKRVIFRSQLPTSNPYMFRNTGGHC